MIFVIIEQLFLSIEMHVHFVYYCSHSFSFVDIASLAMPCVLCFDTRIKKSD